MFLLRKFSKKRDELIAEKVLIPSSDLQFSDDSASKDWRKKATAVELESLRAFHANQNFPDYRELNIDCKRHVTELLSTKARVRLAMCGTEERALLDRFMSLARKLSVSAGGNAFRYQMTFADGDVLEAILSLDGKKVLMGGTKKIRTIKKPSQFYEIAAEILESMLIVFGAVIQELHVGTKFGDYAMDKLTKVPMMSRLQKVCLLNTEHIGFWLDKMPTGLDELSFRRHEEKYNVPPGFREMLDVFGKDDNDPKIDVRHVFLTPQVRTAKRLDDDGGFKELDVEHVSRLQMTSGHLASHVTCHAINAYLKRWQSGEGATGLERVDMCTAKHLDWKTVIEGLDAQAPEDVHADAFKVLERFVVASKVAECPERLLLEFHNTRVQISRLS